MIDALNWRYATQVYDSTKLIPEDQLRAVLEVGRLAPSAFGTEPWKFILVENKELRAALREAAFGQPKVTDAAALIVLAYRTDLQEHIAAERLERTAKIQNRSIESLDGLKKMIEGSFTRLAASGDLLAWSKSQAYIPLGMMITAASLLGIDTGPMEGFSADKVDEILGLKAQGLRSTSMLAVGYRGEDAAALQPKVRRSFEDVVDVRK